MITYEKGSWQEQVYSRMQERIKEYNSLKPSERDKRAKGVSECFECGKRTFRIVDCEVDGAGLPIYETYVWECFYKPCSVGVLK